MSKHDDKKNENTILNLQSEIRVLKGRLNIARANEASTAAKLCNEIRILEEENRNMAKRISEKDTLDWQSTMHLKNFINAMRQQYPHLNFGF